MCEQGLILLVDDDYNDGTLMQRAFVGAKVLNPIVVMRSGEEAIDYLGGTGKYANRTEFPLPTLILLDIKMNGMNGLQVLSWIRGQPGLRTIRVVMLTSSNDTREVNLAYHLGANSFLTKPVDFGRLVEMARALSGYWLWMDNSPDAHRPTPFDPGNSTSHWPHR
jgi:CheY-like chemotaxis protein